jgi:hypothetical protein
MLSRLEDEGVAHLKVMIIATVRTYSRVIFLPKHLVSRNVCFEMGPLVITNKRHGKH